MQIALNPGAYSALQRFPLHEKSALIFENRCVARNRASARSIGLPDGQKIRALGAGGTVDAEIVSGVSMQVGGMRFDKMTVAVMDLAPISRAIGRP